MKTKYQGAARWAAIAPLLMIAAVAQSPASAAGADESILVAGERAGGTVTRTTTVQLADLDLADAAAQRRLQHRIGYAAKQVCDRSARWGLHARADYQRCTQTARNDAEAQLGRSALAAAKGPGQLSMR